MGRIKVKYANGAYWSEGSKVLTERIRAADRRRLRTNVGKELIVDTLPSKSIRDTASRLRPRR